MILLLLEPEAVASGRGNATTAARYAAAATAAGWTVLRGTPTQHSVERVDLIHAHHAMRCGPSALRLTRQQNCPLVVSLGGTDLHGQDASGLDPLARAPLQQATRIVGPFAEDAALLQAAGIDTAHYRVVRRGVAVATPSSHTVSQVGLRLLSLGALRPLKNTVAAIEIATALRAAGMRCTLRVVGAALNEQYATQVRARLGQNALQHASQDALQNAVEPGALPALFADTDLLLNTSLAEGASNALLEALGAGVPVAASSVHGNVALLRNAPAQVACLFDLASPLAALLPFVHSLEQATQESWTTRALCARRFVQQHHATADEARELLQVWNEALSAPPCRQ